MTVESPNMIPPEALDLSRENISRMSPDMARDTLAAMQRQWAAENPIDFAEQGAFLRLTPEQATAKLEAMRPQGPDGKPIPPAPISIMSSEQLNARRAEEAITDFEANHFPARTTDIGADIWNLMDGKSPVTADVLKAAETKLAQFVKDHAWGKRLMEGDPATTREFHLATAIVTAGRIQRDNA